jgi:hypothetical protein
MHREILGFGSIKQDPRLVDHRNRNGLDNRRENLRPSTNSQNLGNRIGSPNSSSKYKGVHWDSTRGKWRTQAQHDGKTYRLGRFDSEEEAAAAYDRKALELWGEFALLNFPGPK